MFNVQLASLVPRIAPNIGSLLKRYEQGASINKIEAVQDSSDKFEARIAKTYAKKGRNGKVNRGRGYNSNIHRGFNPRNIVTARGSRELFCPACFYLSQQLNTPIHFKHSVGDCPRRAVTVKLLNMEDEVNFEDDDQGGEVTVGKRYTPSEQRSELLLKFQTPEKTANSFRNQKSIDAEQCDIIVDKANSQNPSVNDSSANNMISDKIDYENWTLKLQKLESRQGQWSSQGVRKAMSPKLLVDLGGVEIYATVDEGSEINCIDESCAVRNKITFEQTTCQAKAAGSSQMRLAGQT